MHLRDAWHQILLPSVHPRRPSRHGDRVSGTDGPAPLASDEHRPALEQPLTIHRHHGHVSEGDPSGGIAHGLRDDETDHKHGDNTGNADDLGGTSLSSSGPAAHVCLAFLNALYCRGTKSEREEARTDLMGHG